MKPVRTQRRRRTLLRRITGRAWRTASHRPHVAPIVSDAERELICRQEAAAARRRDYRHLRVG